MTPLFRDARTFAAALADMAEALRVSFLHMQNDIERSDHLEKLVAESDMVFGVWPDSGTENGVGLQVLKGDDLIPPLVGFETEQELRITAIPCASRDVALAAREAWNGLDGHTESDQSASTASEKLSASEAERSKWATLRRSAPP